MSTATKTVYILMLSGDPENARRIVQTRYPHSCQVLLSKRVLRENGWRGQIRTLRKLRGAALVIFTESQDAIREPLLLLCSGFLHACRETTFADHNGELKVYKRMALLRHLPVLLFSSVLDLMILIAGSVLLRIFCSMATPRCILVKGELDVAYLYPFPLDRAISGGAPSHVAGFLSGLAENGTACEIFSGRPMPGSRFPVHEVPNRRRLYIFGESQALSYNLHFALSVRRYLAGRRPTVLYQRHGRFVVAGALLSRLTGIPLVLEYNGSESWVAKHWDPARFRRVLHLCEQACIKTAFLIVVVSQALRDELVQQGIPQERILVNPNGVDPGAFHPGCGGAEMRTQLGFASDHVVVSFVGSFAYWHGIAVLQRALVKLLQRSKDCSALMNLRFLLVGDGVLRTEIREALREYEQSGWVVFTGLLPHEAIPSLLDASDILVSPHVPMPDGRPFFGSPTKLFEYMAMAKAIIASDLDQLAQVLTHGTTAWLVRPGSDVELTAAIEMLAQNPELRSLLGRKARAHVLDHYTWRVNAERALARISGPRVAPSVSSKPTCLDSTSSEYRQEALRRGNSGILHQ
jgi:glycosyltransferase involved in cell wall biosynthesis